MCMKCLSVNDICIMVQIKSRRKSKFHLIINTPRLVVMPMMRYLTRLLSKNILNRSVSSCTLSGTSSVSVRCLGRVSRELLFTTLQTSVFEMSPKGNPQESGWLSYTKNNFIIKIYTSYFWITIENLTCFFIRNTQQVNKYFSSSFFYNLFTYVYSVNTVLFFHFLS